MKRSFASTVRPALETLETRDMLSASPLGTLLTQPLGHLTTQMSNSMTVLRSDSSNLFSDLRSFQSSSNTITLQDYSRTAFDYGQIEGFSQGITAVGKADLEFLAVAGGISTSDISSLLPLLTLSKDLSSATKNLNQTFSIVNKNPSTTALNHGFSSVLAFLSE